MADPANTEAVLNDDIWAVNIPSAEELKRSQNYVEEHERKLSHYRTLHKEIRNQRAKLKKYTGAMRGSQNFMEQQEALEDLERQLTKVDLNLYKSTPEFWRIKKNITFANKPHGGKRTYRRRRTVRRRRTMRARR